MPEVLWRTLMRQCPVPHLVLGVVSDGAAAKLRLAQLARLARALRLSGLYALADVPDRDGSQVRCALENAADADKLGAAVDASTTGRTAEWASQRTFRFDRAREDAIVDTLKQRGGRSRPAKRRSGSIL